MKDDSRRQDALSSLAGSLDLPARFASLSPARRLEAILNLPDPGRFIEGLRADDLYFLISGIGFGEAFDLLAYSTKEQRLSFLDLEVWTGWHFQEDRFDRILELAWGVSGEFALDLLRQTDLELLALNIFKSCSVTLVRDEEDTPSATDTSFPTPDGVFLVHCRDSDRIPAIRRFLDLLYGISVVYAHQIIQGGMRDTIASLEELSFQHRDNRLQELGFAPEKERFDLWEPFDSDGMKARVRTKNDNRRTRPRAGTETPPLALTLKDTDRDLFFWRVAANLQGDPELPGYVGDLLFLVNRVLGARSDDMSEDRLWEEAAAHAVTMASLGLEDLAEGDPETAQDILFLTAPMELYRNGVESLRSLHLDAIAVSRQVGGPQGLDILGDRRAKTVRSSLVFPPKFWTGLKDGSSSGRRDFVHRGEVQLAQEMVRDTRAVLDFASQELGFAFHQSTEEASGSMEPTLGNVLATAWARGVLQGDPAPMPLNGEEVRDLLTTAFSGGRIRPNLRSDALSGNEAVQAFMEEALDVVEEALGGLDPGKPVEARFLGNSLLYREDT